MSDSDSFIDEVTEEVRRDRMHKIWWRYGPWLIGVILLVAIGLMANAWMSDQQLQSQRDDTVKFLEARAFSNPAERAEAMGEYVGATESGLALLGRLEAASAHLRADDAEAAKAEYDSIVADASVKQEWRDYARLRSLIVGFDGADSAAFAEEIAPFAAPDSPWRFIAAEYQAAAYLRAGDAAQAKKTLQNAIADAQASPSFKAYAEAVVEALGGA